MLRKAVTYLGEGVVALLLILLVLRIAAPYVIEWAINRQIDRTEGLYGQVADVDLHLYRGGYEVEGIELYMDKGDKQFPLLSMTELDLSILWKALFDGHIVAEAVLVDPVMTLVDREDKEVVTNEAVKDEKTWIELLNSITPFSIDRLEIINGEFHFKKPDGEPKVDLFLTDIRLLAQNITNSKEVSDTLMASLEADAQAMGESAVNFSGKYNPFENTPTFDLNLEMQRLEMVHLDNFIKAYTPLDIEAGSLDLALELAAKEGRIDGYLKPGIYDVDVFDWREDIKKDDDNIFEALVDAIAGGLAGLLENDKKDLLATRIPLEGDVSAPDTPIFPIIGGILKNGFVQAYKMEVDDTISLEDAAEEDKN